MLKIVGYSWHSYRFCATRKLLGLQKLSAFPNRTFFVFNSWCSKCCTMLIRGQRLLFHNKHWVPLLTAEGKLAHWKLLRVSYYPPELYFQLEHWNSAVWWTEKEYVQEVTQQLSWFLTKFYVFLQSGQLVFLNIKGYLRADHKKTQTAEYSINDFRIWRLLREPLPRSVSVLCINPHCIQAHHYLALSDEAWQVSSHLLLHPSG